MHKSLLAFLLIILITLWPPGQARAQMTSKSNTPGELAPPAKQASHFAALALKCVSREFPNKPEHVINDAADVKNPKLLHPAFYGCYDWHSSVHGHWMLVRLLRSFPGLPEAAQILNALNTNLTAV